MNKKTIVLLLAVLALSTLTACGSKAKDVAKDIAATEVTETQITEEMTSEEVPEVTSERATGEGIAESKFTVDFPEEFVPSEENPDLYITADYPTDAANIVIVEAANGGTISAVTETLYKDALEQSYAQQGMETTITVDEFTTLKIEEYDSIRAKIHYELNGVKITQLQYMVDDGVNSYTVTYTNVNDGAWMDAFEESAATIRFE